MGLLREMMASNPEWWGDDVDIVRRAVLFDEPSFDYGDGGRLVEDWSGKVGSNGGDRELLGGVSEEQAVAFVDRQEAAFAELIQRGCPELATAGLPAWQPFRFRADEGQTRAS